MVRVTPSITTTMITSGSPDTVEPGIHKHRLCAHPEDLVVWGGREGVNRRSCTRLRACISQREWPSSLACMQFPWNIHEIYTWRHHAA